MSRTVPCSEIGGTLSISGIANCVVPCSAYFSKSSSSMCLASGPNLSKKSLRSVRSRSARSRRVRSGALKAKWQSRSKGSASGCLSQFVEFDAPVGQCSDDLVATAGVCPAVAKLGGVGKQGPNLVGRVVGILHHPQLIALRVEFIDQMGRNFDLPAIDVELPSLAARQDWVSDDLAIVARVFLAGRDFRLFAGWVSFIINGLFGHGHWVAVELRVGEQPGRLGEVEDVEEVFAVIVSQSSAPADDLLELDDGVDHAGQTRCSCRSERPRRL